MIDFDFVSPTKIFFGKDKENNIGEICKSYGFSNICIVIGQGHVKSSGLLQRVLDSLDKCMISHFIYEGVRPNPTTEQCAEVIEILRKNNCGLILAIGGGSVIDVAKNAACGFFYSGDSFDFNKHIVSPKSALPIGVILTIAAAGSELSNSCVIQSDQEGIKSGFNSDLVRPLFVIENPELTYDLPSVQTAYGIVDIMMHTMERYLQKSDETEPADGFAEALLRNVIKAGKIAYKNPKDYDSRAILMLMSSLSHNGLTHIGKPFGMPVHQLEHAVSGLYPNVAHGAGLAMLFPIWAEYYLYLDTAKFANLARNVFGINKQDDKECAKAGINELRKLYDYLGMPRNFRDLGIDNPDVHKLAELCTANGTKEVKHYIHSLNMNEVEDLYKKCI